MITSTLEESGSSTQISSVTYGYDALGRVSYETDSRNGTTYYTYNSQGQVTRVDYPSGGPVIPSHSELEYEDNTGHLISETQPDGGVKRYKYNKKGEKVFEYGTRTNPVKYEYDAQGRMIKMWTHKDFSGDPGSPGTGALTQWTYNQYTGSLKEKTDA